MVGFESLAEDLVERHPGAAIGGQGGDFRLLGGGEAALRHYDLIYCGTSQ